MYSTDADPHRWISPVAHTNCNAWLRPNLGAPGLVSMENAPISLALRHPINRRRPPTPPKGRPSVEIHISRLWVRLQVQVFVDTAVERHFLAIAHNCRVLVANNYLLLKRKRKKEREKKKVNGLFPAISTASLITKRSSNLRNNTRRLVLANSARPPWHPSRPGSASALKPPWTVPAGQRNIQGHHRSLPHRMSHLPGMWAPRR